jgi:hypothetical protein
MKNRKREICTSGSVRDEDGQPPHLLGRRNFLHLAAISVQRFGAIVTTPWIASLRADMIFREGQGLPMRRLTRLAPI